MMVHVCYLILWRKRQEDSTLEASLGYMVNLLKKVCFAKPTRLKSQAYVA